MALLISTGASFLHGLFRLYYAVIPTQMHPDLSAVTQSRRSVACQLRGQTGPRRLQHLPRLDDVYHRIYLLEGQALRHVLWSEGRNRKRRALGWVLALSDSPDRPSAQYRGARPTGVHYLPWNSMLWSIRPVLGWVYASRRLGRSFFSNQRKQDRRNSGASSLLTSVRTEERDSEQHLLARSATGDGLELVGVGVCCVEVPTPTAWPNPKMTGFLPVRH